jgi:hypothetical protein
VCASHQAVWALRFVFGFMPLQESWLKAQHPLMMMVCDPVSCMVAWAAGVIMSCTQDDSAGMHSGQVVRTAGTGVASRSVLQHFLDDFVTESLLPRVMADAKALTQSILSQKSAFLPSSNLVPDGGGAYVLQVQRLHPAYLFVVNASITLCRCHAVQFSAIPSLGCNQSAH